MSAKANYFKLGLFIILAVGLAIAAVLVLGAGKFFEKKITVETYLDQSVQGIEVGPKVKFRGVTVGNIRKIDFTRNRYEHDKLLANRHSYVLLEIEITGNPFGDDPREITDQHLAKEIEHGLRARLTSQGVTGTSYLDVDYLRSVKHPLLPIDWTPAHPYIPSAPSVPSRIFSLAEGVFGQLEKIDFERIASSGQFDLVAGPKGGGAPLTLLNTNAVSSLSELRDSQPTR